jgi:anti-anti-sigma regulatory factor
MNYVNTVQLFASSPSGLRAQAVTAANETIRLGQTQLIVDLDNLTHMDDAVLSALILALRRLREAGASLRVHTSKDPIRSYLDSTGMELAFGTAVPARNENSRPGRLPRRPYTTGARNPTC